MKELKCKKCKRIWVYKGKKKFWATCPECYTKVKIVEEAKNGVKKK